MQSLTEARQQADRDAIYKALNEVQGHIGRAAKGLGISRASLYRLLTRYGIVPAQVVADYRPHAVAWTWRRAHPLLFQICGKPCVHGGALARHQRTHQPTWAERGGQG
mgnify:CR=1 FL=1